MQKITLKINGIQRQVNASPEMVLIDLLREDQRLTGTKQSCDRKGQCGACTVIVNGKAVRSCITKVSTLEGAELSASRDWERRRIPTCCKKPLSCRGGTMRILHAGHDHGCQGAAGPKSYPDKEAIKKALARNLCRCTGYKKIIEAVQLAGRFMRKETTPAEVRSKISKDAGGLAPQTDGDDQSLRRSAIQRRYKVAVERVRTGGSIQHTAPRINSIRR